MPKQGKQYQVIVTVKEVKGRCPNFSVGDRFVINRQTMPLKDISCDSQSLCYHALCGFYGHIMMVRGGIVESTIVQCLDPGPEYIEGGGTCIFEISRGEEIVY